MIIETKYDLKEIVYLITDTEQLPRIVTGITLRDKSILYTLASGSFESSHYDFEICTEKDIVMVTSN